MRPIEPCILLASAAFASSALARDPLEKVLAEAGTPAPHRRTSTSPKKETREEDALEAEARRLEERAIRNVERSEGLSPARQKPPPGNAIGTRSAPDAAAERRRVEVELQAEPEARVRPEKGRRRVDDDAQAVEERRRILEEDDQRRAAEERRRSQEATKAADQARAAAAKAEQDSAKKLGGKLDKDGQFVDPDIDK